MDFPCQRDQKCSPKQPRSWTFVLEQVQGDLYALTQGGETSLGTRDDIRTRLNELIGGFYGLGRTVVEGD